MARQRGTKRGKSWAEMSPAQRRLAIVGAAVQIGLQAAALVDLRRRRPEEVRGPKWPWAAATFVNTLGPVTYFLFGRRRGGGTS
jgi:hypothetical protein